MSVSSDSAEQVMRLTLEGTEVLAKITGVAAKNIAAFIYATVNDKKKTKGKTRLINMLKSNSELKVFSIKKEDLRLFAYGAKHCGVLYSVLVDRKNKFSEDIDIMVKAEHAPLVNIVSERYNINTTNKAKVETKAGRENELSNNFKEKLDERTEVNDTMIDDIMGESNEKKEKQNINPNVAKTEKNPPLEHSLKNTENSEGVIKPVPKKSVKEKLQEAIAELKFETELKRAQKLKEHMVAKIPQKQTKQTSKLEKSNKERGK